MKPGEVNISLPDVALAGELVLPAEAKGLVIFRRPVFFSFFGSFIDLKNKILK